MWQFPAHRDGDRAPKRPQSGKKIKVFNVLSTKGPVLDDRGRRVAYILPENKAWNAKTFFDDVLPAVLPAIAAECRRLGKIGILYIDGEKLQMVYPFGSYVPHRHNLQSAGKSDAYLFFGKQKGHGAISNLAFLESAGINKEAVLGLRQYVEAGGVRRLETLAEAATRLAWTFEEVRSQRVRFEQECLNLGLIGLFNIPGYPQGATVERDQRSMKAFVRREKPGATAKEARAKIVDWTERPPEYAKYTIEERWRLSRLYWPLIVRFEKIDDVDSFSISADCLYLMLLLASWIHSLSL